MSVAVAASAAKVHLEIPGAQALSERTSNTHPWNACSVIAEADALHLCPWNAVPLSANTVAAWRWQYIQYGHWSKNQSEGATLGDIYWHLTETPVRAHIAGYIPFSNRPNLDQLHTFVKAQSLLQNPIILEVSNAQALSHAERGVAYHFVTLAGIDSDLGYLTLNGDTTDALTTAATIVPAYWNSWATLAQAGICGAIALDRGYTAPSPPTSPVTPPPSDSSSDLHALAADVLSALEKLTAALP